MTYSCQNSENPGSPTCPQGRNTSPTAECPRVDPGPPGPPGYTSTPFPFIPAAEARNNPIPGCVDNRSSFGVVACRDDGHEHVLSTHVPPGEVTADCRPWGTDWDAVLVRGQWYRIRGTTAIVTDQAVYNCSCRLPDLSTMGSQGCGRSCDNPGAEPCQHCNPWEPSACP